MIRLLILILALASCKELPEETPFSDENFNSGGNGQEITDDAPQNPLCGPMQGFLWKPQSDSDGNAVVLLPPVFKAEFISVCTFNSDNDECARFTGFSNGDRQTWRFREPGCKYGKRFRVIATEPKQDCEFRVRNGCNRSEN